MPLSLNNNRGSVLQRVNENRGFREVVSYCKFGSEITSAVFWRLGEH